MVAVGLQPGIGAGCVLRTENRYFDMSLGKRFGGSRELLMKRLNEVAALPSSDPSVPANDPVGCLLYTSDAADDLLCVDLGGRRIIKKKKKTQIQKTNTR